MFGNISIGNKVYWGFVFVNAIAFITGYFFIKVNTAYLVAYGACTATVFLLLVPSIKQSMEKLNR